MPWPLQSASVLWQILFFSFLITPEELWLQHAVICCFTTPQGPCGGLNSICPPKIYVHLEPWNVTLYGDTIFVVVIALAEVILG